MLGDILELVKMGIFLRSKKTPKGNPPRYWTYLLHKLQGVWGALGEVYVAIIRVYSDLKNSGMGSLR